MTIFDPISGYEYTRDQIARMSADTTVCVEIDGHVSQFTAGMLR